MLTGVVTNRTGMETVSAKNFTECKIKCAKKDCSCLDYVERADGVDPSISDNPFLCNLYYGNLGQTVFYDISNHDALRSLTAIAVGPSQVLGETSAVFEPKHP